MYGTVHSRFTLVVVAASQGGLRAYLPILGALPHPLPVPLVVAQHRLAGGELPALLRARLGRPVEELADGCALEAGTLYVSPAEAVTRLAADGRARVEPLESGVRCLRPADELLASAAAVHGAGTIAVVLSGRLDDGAAGARAVKHRGGRVFVQDPATAQQPAMPAAALATGGVDLCAAPATIAAALSAFLTVPGAAELFRTRMPAWAYATRASAG